jgi:hypothetical protein
MILALLAMLVVIAASWGINGILVFTGCALFVFAFSRH